MGRDGITAFETNRFDISWAHPSSSWPVPWERKLVLEQKHVLGPNGFRGSSALLPWWALLKKKKRIIFYGCIGVKIQADSLLAIHYYYILFFRHNWKEIKTFLWAPKSGVAVTTMSVAWWRSQPRLSPWRTSGIAGKVRVWKRDRVKFTPRLLS